MNSHTAEMIGSQGPSVHQPGAGRRQGSGPAEEGLAVHVIPEGALPFDPPKHGMVQDASRRFWTQRGRAAKRRPQA